MSYHVTDYSASYLCRFSAMYNAIYSYNTCAAFILQCMYIPLQHAVWVWARVKLYIAAPLSHSSKLNHCHHTTAGWAHWLQTREGSGLYHKSEDTTKSILIFAPSMVDLHTIQAPSPPPIACRYWLKLMECSYL